MPFHIYMYTVSIVGTVNINGQKVEHDFKYFKDTPEQDYLK